jgi:hypothetical protein
MYNKKNAKLRFRVFAVLVLGVEIAFLGLSEQKVEARLDIPAMYQCYNNFASFVDFCTNRGNLCRNPQNDSCNCGGDPTCIASCVQECNTRERECGYDSTHYFGNCMADNAFSFEMEECPNAPEAAGICDAAMSSCEAAAQNIPDAQEANALVAECMYTHYSCLQDSGLWACQ